MTHRIKALVQRQPGALQRILVTASRRGYEPVAMIARLEGNLFRVDLEVESDRSVEPLARALDALFDIHSLEAI